MRDILERALWTLIQAAGAVGVATVVVPGISCTAETSGGALVVGVIAAASSVFKGAVKGALPRGE